MDQNTEFEYLSYPGVLLDTAEESRKKEIEIFMAKTPAERAKIGMEMTGSMRTLEKHSIMARYPHYTKKEVTAELFRRYYQNDFPAEKVTEIIRSS